MGPHSWVHCSELESKQMVAVHLSWGGRGQSQGSRSSWNLHSQGSRGTRCTDRGLQRFEIGFLMSLWPRTMLCMVKLKLYWRGCGEKGTLVHCWWECRLVQPLWKTWNFLRKLKMELPFDPGIPLLGLYPKNPESPVQKNLCTPTFIAVLFTIAKC